MDEKSTITSTPALRRPWNTPSRIVAWLSLLIVSAFAIICATVLLTDKNVRTAELIPFALVISVVLACGALGFFWFFRWIRSWKNFRRFLFVVACLVTLILLAYAEENWRGKRAWEKHRQYWEVRGEKFRLAEFVPAPVPDDKNFAMTPLLKPAMEIMRQTPVASRDTNALARLDRTSAQLSGGPGKNDNLKLGNVEMGTYADLAACADFYRDNTNYPQAAPGAKPAEVILTALSGCDPEIKELREAAAARPYCRFPIAYDHEPPWDILLPHLSRIKNLVVLMHVRAVGELESGRPQEAFEDLNLAFRLADSIGNEPILIDHLVRISSLSIASQIVREGIMRHAWTDSQLAEIETHLRSVDLIAEYQRVMRGERAFGMESMDYLRRNGIRNHDMQFPTEVRSSVRRFNPMPNGWFYQNMLTISDMYQQFCVPSVDPQAHRVFPNVVDKEEAALTQMRTGPYTIFAKLLLPAVQRAIVRSSRAQVTIDCARIACALERYRLTNRNLPDSLSALAPAFLQHTPTDIIDGQPLRYRLEPDGNYLLYSVGWNRADDGGQLAWSSKPASKGHVDETAGDWVWTIFPGRRA